MTHSEKIYSRRSWSEVFFDGMPWTGLIVLFVSAEIADRFQSWLQRRRYVGTR